MAETDTNTSNVHDDDDESRNGIISSSGGASESVTGNSIPANRKGAKIDSVDAHPVVPDYNYSTISRWKYRLSLWETHLATSSDANDLPTEEAFLYAKLPEDDKNSIQYLLWGSGEDSLTSLQRAQKGWQSELEVLKKDHASLSSDVAINVDEEEVPNESRIPAETDLNSEVLALIHGVHEAHIKEQLLKEWQVYQEACIREREALIIRDGEARIRIRKARIREREALIREREARIRELKVVIKALKVGINDKLGRILERHQKMRNVLSELAVRRHDSVGTPVPSWSLDKERFDMSPACEPRPSNVEEIRRVKADENFLTELLQKKEIHCKKGDLRNLQTFVADIMENAEVIEKKKKKVDLTHS